MSLGAPKRNALPFAAVAVMFSEAEEHRTCEAGAHSAGEPLRRAVFLHPGQLCAAAEPVATTTILGSCVSVCLFDPKTRIGGTNHFLLPSGAPQSTKYAEPAIRLLVSKIEALGGRPSNLVAKMFGGACVLDAFRAGAGGSHLGAKNVEAARRVLSAIGIPLVAEDVGGDRGRKVIFFCDTGDVLVKAV